MFRALLALLGIAAEPQAHLLRTAVREHRDEMFRARQVGQAVACNEEADKATADLVSQVASFRSVDNMRDLTAGVLDRKPRNRMPRS